VAKGRLFQVAEGMVNRHGLIAGAACCAPLRDVFSEQSRLVHATISDMHALPQRSPVAGVDAATVDQKSACRVFHMSRHMECPSP
jgi:hypothetical protein